MAEQRADRKLRKVVVAVLLPLLVVVVGACQVRPLYAPTAAGVDMRAELSQIDVAPVQGRAGQVVRNELLFLLHGGQHAGGAYQLRLSVRQRESDSLVRRVEGEPHNRMLQLQVSYRLIRSGDGTQLLTGRVTRTATYEFSRQRFANDRALLDAVNRAAGEVAEDIRMRLAMFFAAGGVARPHASPELESDDDSFFAEDQLFSDDDPLLDEYE